MFRPACAGDSFAFRLRVVAEGGECEAELRGTHSQAELGNDTEGALLPFVLRACCGGMCWPVDRPATHAAAGAAARGVLVSALCPAKRRFAFSPMGRHARLAAEIPDIFLPLARNENSGMTMLFFSLGIAPVSVCVDHGSGHSAPCRLRRDGTRRFWFGGLFYMLGAWERHRFNGGAVAVCF